MAEQRLHDPQIGARVAAPLALPQAIVLELRAGVGGCEASLFAEQLLRMYEKFAAKMKWKSKLLALNRSKGGVKEAVLEITGWGASRWLEHEVGVHRVQRVPRTETRGRVHTSTATLALLPPFDGGDKLGIETSDLRIETMRASGAGGQHVNTTDSAVRITHLPTGMTVRCSQRSQHSNRTNALRILSRKLSCRATSDSLKARAAVRALQVGCASRTEKIRTYSFVQDRVTDHRLGRSVSCVSKVLAGDLRPLITTDSVQLC
ncbi:MAG: PCRF domain-containing protein [Candidatus Hodgkinia cicadicola]